MKRSLAMASAAVAACVAAGTPLHAQGSSVDQQSACMTGRVGTGVASPCDDGSAVYFSPAALATQRSAVSAGVSFVNSSNTFRYDIGRTLNDPLIEREPETVPVPQAFLNVRASDRLAVGVGVFAPYGLGLKWDVCEVDEAFAASCTAEGNFEGRFTGYDNAFRGVYVQPTVSYQLVPNRLSVGVGADYVLGSIEVNRRSDVPGSGLRGIDVVDANLAGEGTGFTFHVGALAQLSERLSLGVRYLHSAEVDMDGDADFTPVTTPFGFVNTLIAGQVASGALADQGISTTIEFPSQLVAGLSFAATERLNLMADYQRTGWESFDAFDIDFENAAATDQVLNLGYQNTNTFRVAADFMATDALALRAGFRYNTEASPRATPFLPEFERNYFSAGIGYAVGSRLGLDLAYQYIQQPDRRGAVRPGEGTVGVYTAKGQIFGVTLSYRFGRDRNAANQ
ncbi:MAG TPA: outer membrane protein transport protein [Longimicrobium sp.]|jgi:long-chain fatty acid transport protein